MAKVIIAGTLNVAPEKRDPAIRDAKPLIDEALAEPGSVAYDWSFDAFDPGRIHIYEQWESEAMLSDHLVAPSYLKMLAHLGAVGILSTVTRKFKIAAEAPVYVDGKARGDFPSS